jgi:hypothetical protein
MLITQKEAAEKWCQESFNGARAKCIGPECMAWRWAESVPSVCIKCGSEDTVREDRPELRKGYCGLAGVSKW